MIEAQDKWIETIYKNLLTARTHTTKQGKILQQLMDNEIRQCHNLPFNLF